jgi:hypothetical protein
LNIEPKGKLTNSSVKPQEQGEVKYSPDKVRKGPDKESGEVRMHLTGATSYEHSKTNVNEGMKQVVSSNSSTARNGAAYAQLQVPKRDYESRRGPVAHATARIEAQDNIKRRPGDGKNAGVETHQYLTRDLSQASRDTMCSHVRKIGELFGTGVSTNARGGTSTKNSAITTINRCKGERGQHNY